MNDKMEIPREAIIERIEAEAEKNIKEFIQNIVNGHAQMKNEYLQFIYSESVDLDKLVSVLNKVRLSQKLYSASMTYITDNGIVKTEDSFISYNKEELLVRIEDLKTDIRDILYRTQKEYNQSFDIDDEEEYQKVQKEVRERRRKYRNLDDIFTAYYEIINNYVAVKEISHNNLKAINEDYPIHTDQEVEDDVILESEQEAQTEDIPDLSEQAFCNWLLSEIFAPDSTIKQSVLNIHRIEKLYQNLFGIRENLLGTTSPENAKKMIEVLILRKEFIEANESRENSFKRALNLFAQFAGIHIDGLKPTTSQSDPKSMDSSDPSAKIVDFDNPNSYTYSKPRMFILNGVKYTVGSWSELYTKFIVLLYSDNEHSKIIKGLIGKSLYGHRIDFADKTLSHYLRKSIRVSSNLFAEGNLSAIGTIKRIKCLMDLCSIDNEHMIIEYCIREKDNESNDLSSDDYEQLSIPEMSQESEEIERSVLADYSEESFFSWLVNNDGSTINSAKNHISNIHKIENLYYSIFGVKKLLLGISSPDHAKEILERLFHRDEYIDANSRRNNGFTFALRKYSKFVGLLKTLDFNNPDESTKCNPCFINCIGLKHYVGSWREAYSIILRAIYTNTNLTEKLRNLIGKELYGANIDFSDDKLLDRLRKPVHILNDFYAEGDLSTIEIINRIKNLMFLCSIDDNKIKIEYFTYDMNNEVLNGNESNSYSSHECEIPRIDDHQAEVTNNGDKILIEDNNEVIVEPTITLSSDDPEHFSPDTTKPFILKDVVIEILSSNTPEISKYRAYKNGITPKALREILKEYYGKSIEIFELSKLLMLNSAFRSVGKGCYILSSEMSLQDVNTVDQNPFSQDNLEDKNHKNKADEISNDSDVATFKNDYIAMPIEAKPVIPEERDVTPENDFQSRIGAYTGNISLKLNRKFIVAYDYSDAVNKVCEFAIKYNPFRMARIASQQFKLRDKYIFYRKSVPVEGYVKLSNGLQVISIDNISDLYVIVDKVKKYCQINDNMVSIVIK